MNDRDPAGAVFEALADPMRRRLLQTISASPAGLLERQRSGRDVRYRVTPAPLSDAVSWMAGVGGQWDERLERLAALSKPGAGRAPTLH